MNTTETATQDIGQARAAYREFLANQPSAQQRALIDLVMEHRENVVRATFGDSPAEMKLVTTGKITERITAALALIPDEIKDGVINRDKRDVDAFLNAFDTALPTYLETLRTAPPLPR